MNIPFLVDGADILYLVHLLDWHNVAIEEYETVPMSILPQFNVFKAFVVGESVVPPLIRLLEFGTSFCKEKAVEAL